MDLSQRSRLLVAGGAGFLGSHLCDRLIGDGYAVLCIDNFLTGARRNIEHLIGTPHFRLMQHDIRDPVYLENAGIYNLACPASPVHYQADPICTLLTNVSGVHNLLTLAQWSGTPLFQASTSEVYGDAKCHPQSEGYWGHVNPTGIRACYDEGKRCGETLCFDHHRRFGTRVKVGRIFNTYGPRMQPDDGRVVSNFIVQALRNQPLTIYGNGQQTRSFCYVDDMIEAIVRMARAPAPLTGPVNLGNPGECTVAELAELVIELTGSRARPVRKPLPQDDPVRRCPDIALARHELDWQPRTGLRDGIARTIQYFDDLLALDEDLVPVKQAAESLQVLQA